MYGENLAAQNALKGLCDPYVKLLHNGRTYHETFVCFNTINPHWYQSFIIPNISDTDTLHLELWDYSLLSLTEKFAELEIPFHRALRHSAHVLHANSSLGYPVRADAALQRQLAQWYSIPKSGRVAVLVVETGWLRPLDPANRYTQFINKKARPAEGSPSGALLAVAGAVAGVGRVIHPTLDLRHPMKHMLRAHSTYAVKLSHVQAVFGSRRQGWNRRYHAAKRIFKGPLAAPMQLALNKQHRYLYGSLADGSPIADLRKRVGQCTGALLDGDDFVKLMEAGVRAGKRRVYTYVVMEDELRFCETGASIHKDLDSKHAMHACAAKEVVYAGEFHFRERRMGNGVETRIVIDNNSGTYAPDAADLGMVGELLRRNFEGLVVETIDFKSDKLKEYNLQLSREA